MAWINEGINMIFVGLVFVILLCIMPYYCPVLFCLNFIKFFHLFLARIRAYFMPSRLQDMSLQPPAQELVAKDLHGFEWHFRHIYRGKLSYFMSNIPDLVATMQPSQLMLN